MRLDPFQEKTVRYLWEHPHRLLLDEPGVGKTPPTCVALRDFPYKTLNRSLIICPPGYKSTWAYRLKQWGCDPAIEVVNSASDHISIFAKYIIVSPQLLLKKQIQQQLCFLMFDVIVIDEAHQFKNPHAKGAKYVYQQLIRQARAKWILTGSLIPKRIVDLYLPIKVLFPDVLGPYLTFDKFTKRFCGGYFNGTEWIYKGSSHIDDLAERLKGVALLRKLRDVYPELPPVIEDEFFIDIDIEESERNTQVVSLEMAVGIAKINPIVSWIFNWLDANEGKKLLVYTRNRLVTEQIAAELDKAEIDVQLYYGGMNSLQKVEALGNFADTKGRVLVANRNSIGTATDGLQHVCSYILEAQLDWSAGITDQGYGRLVRRGQTQTVTITRAIATDTIEEVILSDYYAQKKNIAKLLRSNGMPTIEDLLIGIDEKLGQLVAQGKPSTVIGAPALNTKSVPDTSKSVKPVKESVKPATKSKKDVPPQEPSPEPEYSDNDLTLEELQELAGEVRSLLSGGAAMGEKEDKAAKETIQKVISKFGAKSLKDVDSTKYGKLAAALQALLPEEGEGGTDEKNDEENEGEL